ncbi:MAG TPA: glycosyltransferase family 4 protein [Longimicrobiales bacterium]|nr:glycosyltransferase family 4 protein [Longimicrobiales bacterium]
MTPARESGGPPPLSVLMTADTLGGVWTYALELARALSERDVTIGLAAIGRLPEEAQMEEALSVPGLELFCSDYRCEWMDDCWEDQQRSGLWLRELRHELRPDVLHLNAYGHAAEPFDLPVLITAHSCVLSWWEAVYRTRPPARLERYRLHVQRGLRGADVVVAPTRHMLDCLRRHYGDLPRTAVVPNGRSARRFHPAPKQGFVLACGRYWDEAKNLAALEWAAPRIPWPVEVIGPLRSPDGGSPPVRWVRHLGPRPWQAVAQRLGRAAICAHPARYEPFGLVPLEAALSRCCLVLGDTPSLRELWEDAALYVPPDEPAALADALGLLIGSPKLREELAAAAYARALRMTPAAMADAYLRVYHDLRRDLRARRPASRAEA